MNILKITEEEKKSLETYKYNGYKDINNFLTDYSENDIKYANKYENSDELAKSLRKDLKDSIENIKNIYSLMIKNSHKKEINSNKLLRGTSLEEVKSIIDKMEINKFISTTTNRNTMKSFAYDTEKPVLLEIETYSQIPKISEGLF